ncbi:iron complex transport system ATP-binding protein [Desulfocicer vacuolatum DSM 3385]|uniref:Iron complex transport system ATP-binding protein n=1 Tax=Desulfocicer vacuolatum DSM 3385 TaxID=1121400 RepID=A0A1W1YRY6_9BACT|nr:ABC transporter ATP-binding protein [Desulfocicer vacuolatum]SMC38896.1 iron complex transport system ATP-binding protein [Desulfocicer vacuolatum DSM 3385]
MNTQNTILSTRNLCVGYSGKEILKGVELQFKKGEFISLLGPNGAGKTTLLRTLSKHLKTINGKVLVNNEDISAMKQERLAQTMSVVLTEKVKPPLFTVYDFVAMGRYPHTHWSGRLEKKDDGVIMESLTMVHARELVFRDLSTLSDGERQKVLVARALAQQPDIILLDEPTMHLDLKHRMEVMSILQRLCRDKGICVVASLHDVDIAAKLSDKVALVKGGAIQAFGPPENVLQDDAVTQLYDFSNASFNRMLGTIEMKNSEKKGKVFVVGGMGSASVLYRLLAKKEYHIFTGMLHKNDIDYHVAHSLGAHCLVQPHIDKFSEEICKWAKEEMSQCDWVIDTGFGLEKVNGDNICLLKDALAMKKPVLSLRNGQSREHFTALEYDEIHFLDDECQLVDEMETITFKAT